MTVWLRGSLATVFLILGGAALAGPLPTEPPITHGTILAAATDDLAAKRDEYMRKAQDEFQSWQDRMSKWTDEAEANASQAQDQARWNLDKAWTQVKADWRKLQAAAPDGWDKARASFEAASGRLKNVWAKIAPQG